MKFYRIRQGLEECTDRELSGPEPYVAVLSSEEWANKMDAFDMGIEMDIDLPTIRATRAEVNYDSLTGSFSLPDREDLIRPDARFAFALDEKGIVFIDDGDTARSLIESVARTKKWKKPSLERFLYDFLEQIIHPDTEILTRFELELDEIESAFTGEEAGEQLVRLNEIRGCVRDLRMHYEQLLDLSQELEENENGFFAQDNLRYFHLFSTRVANLRDLATFVRDYTVQLREFYESQLDIRQNRIMTILTVVTSIFMPLTLITGWYGMNFRYMPELDIPWAYPAVLGVCVVIVVVCLVYFKKKKWL